MRRHLLISLVLFLLTLIVFAQVRKFDFINVDDSQYIRDNGRVLSGMTFSNIGWAFTTLKMANWHPLAWLSHMADAQMFGVNPAGHHMTSAVIHSINAALVYLVLMSLTGSTWKSAIVAALFAVHPLRMESVAWVSERKDVLCAMFFIAAIGCYGRFIATRSKRWYAALVAAFVLGIMSKPMIVTLPFVLLLIDCWPLKRPARWALLVEKLPLLALSIMSAIVTMIAQSRGGAVVDQHRYPMLLRVGNAIWSYGRYLKKTAWPSDLAAYYPYMGVMPGTSLPWGKAAIAAIVLIALTALTMRMWRIERAALIGWLWFLGVLVPTMGLVQVGTQSMADRYAYLPHIGLFIAIVWGIDAIGATVRPVACAFAGLTIAIFGGCTMYQLHYWQNSGALFAHALEVTDHNAVANKCRGMWLIDEGRGREAEGYFIQALSLDPSDFETEMNYGNLLAERGAAREGLDHLLAAVRVAPRRADVQSNLADVLAQLGRNDEAIQHYQMAIQLDPDLPQPYLNYGITLAQAGRVREALPLFERALQLRPDYQQARQMRDTARKMLGQP